MDKYQQRYLEHQVEKASQLRSSYGVAKKNLPPKYQKYLMAMSRFRASQRNFNGEPISDYQLNYILEIAGSSPSSCNRHATSIKVVTDRDTKQLLGGLLVGGTGWVHRANAILLLVADNEAYKEGLDYMKYLDAGFIGMNVYYACEVLGLGCCFVNPNVRTAHQKHLVDVIPDMEKFTLVGALAIGNYDKKAISKKSIKSDILLDETGGSNS